MRLLVLAATLRKTRQRAKLGSARSTDCLCTKDADTLWRETLRN
jgi:hypothetical protein